MEKVEDLIYPLASPPPKQRTSPLKIICPGPPRSATESLATALQQLGYKTYHGWDILFENPLNLKRWLHLARRKHYGAEDGDCTISAAEFDEIIGHCDAAVDAPASCFAAEMIRAYPDAKVILNTRSDLDAWHRSVVGAQVAQDRMWSLWWISWWTTDMYWIYKLYSRYLWGGLFRINTVGRGSCGTAIARNGKWIYREHCDMIRGLVPRERLLEWQVEDGWAPLCQFLDKEVPDGEFPVRNALAQYEEAMTRLTQSRMAAARRNMGVAAAVIVLVFGVCVGVALRK